MTRGRGGSGAEVSVKSSDDPEENWTVFQTTVHSSAVDTLGHKSRRRQDWFD